MDLYFLYYLIIMMVTGIFGGVVISLTSQGPEKKMLPHVLLGILGSFSVPLFLNMISSRLLQESRSDSVNLLYLISICLVFSLLPSRILIRWKTPDQDPHPPGSSFSKNMEENREERHEKASKAASLKSEPAGRPEGILSENEYRIMKAVAERKNGEPIFSKTAAASVNMSDRDFSETLSLLMAKGYIGQRLSEENKLNFSLSKKGIRILEKYADYHPEVKKTPEGADTSD